MKAPIPELNPLPRGLKEKGNMGELKTDGKGRWDTDTHEARGGVPDESDQKIRSGGVRGKPDQQKLKIIPNAPTERESNYDQGWPKSSRGGGDGGRLRAKTGAMTFNKPVFSCWERWR